MGGLGFLGVPLESQTTNPKVGPHFTIELKQKSQGKNTSAALPADASATKFLAQFELQS